MTSMPGKDKQFTEKDMMMNSPLLCGAAAGAIDEVLPAKQIIDDMVNGQNQDEPQTNSSASL